jgi:hypothetical protein
VAQNNGDHWSPTGTAKRAAARMGARFSGWLKAQIPTKTPTCRPSWNIATDRGGMCLRELPTQYSSWPKISPMTWRILGSRCPIAPPNTVRAADSPIFPHASSQPSTGLVSAAPTFCRLFEQRLTRSLDGVVKQTHQTFPRLWSDTFHAPS